MKKFSSYPSVLLLVLNEGYFLGYIRRVMSGKYADRMQIFRKIDIRLYTAGILAMIAVFFVINAESRLFDYCSYAAYVSIKAGEAEQYHLQYLNDSRSRRSMIFVIMDAPASCVIIVILPPGFLSGLRLTSQ